LVQQILYTSLSSAPDGPADLDGILQQSRHNNAIDGITGLLWSDGTHFLQVFEGPKASVSATASRIWADTRHHQIAVLHQIPIERREFAGWTMAHRRPDDAPTVHDAQMRRLLTHATVTVSKPFHDLIAAYTAPKTGPAT
jgi:hypothetical protein